VLAVYDFGNKEIHFDQKVLDGLMEKASWHGPQVKMERAPMPGESGVIRLGNEGMLVVLAELFYLVLVSAF
jgi:hypothetical protein